MVQFHAVSIPDSHYLWICCICKFLQTQQGFQCIGIFWRHHFCFNQFTVQNKQCPVDCLLLIFFYKHQFPVEPLRCLHFQYDFTVKIIYDNIERYIKGKNKLIAGALYLVSTLFCKQFWQYCHYIWNCTEIKKNTYVWFQAESALKKNGKKCKEVRLYSTMA